jgi:hypothetical protein
MFSGGRRSTPRSLHLTHQLRQVQPECRRQTVEVDDTHVPAPALDIADVARVEARRLRQAFLREVPLEPQASDSSPEGNQYVGSIGSRHAPTLRGKSSL